MRRGPFQKLTALLLTLTLALSLCACGGQGAGESGSQTAGSVSWADLTFDQPVELQYATQFTAAYSKEGYCRIDISISPPRAPWTFSGRWTASGT